MLRTQRGKVETLLISAVPKKSFCHVIVILSCRGTRASTRTRLVNFPFFRVTPHSRFMMSPTCLVSNVRVFASAGQTVRSSSKQQSVPQPVIRVDDLPRRALSLCAATCTALVLGASSPQIPTALAIPQTSECATNSCDDNDYSGKDLTDQYYTKGSVKRAKFVNSNLAGVTLFGADLTEADFTGADLTNANIGQCNLTGTIFTNANLSGAIVSGANMDDVGNIDGSDWTDVIVRKDVNDKLCAKGPTGENPVTGNPTAMTLFCD